MRIFSSFHDYYDSAQGFGQDQTCVYNRTSSTIDLMAANRKLDIPYLYRSAYSPKPHVNYIQTCVGFCGRLYPVIRFTIPIHRICFTLEEVDSLVRGHIKEKDQDGYFQPTRPKDKNSRSRWKKARKHWPSDQWRPYFDEFFTEFEAIRDKHLELFYEHQCPIFEIHTRRSKYWRKEQSLVLNPKLQNHEFYRLFDPFQAYQEISMFFGNMAEPRKPAPVPDDVTMAEIKGFDKFSFRKDPSKKK